MEWQEAVQQALREVLDAEDFHAGNCCAFVSRYWELRTGEWPMPFACDSEEEAEEILEAREGLVGAITDAIGTPNEYPSVGDVVAIDIGSIVSAGVLVDGYVVAQHPEHGPWRCPVSKITASWTCPRQ